MVLIREGIEDRSKHQLSSRDAIGNRYQIELSENLQYSRNVFKIHHFLIALSPHENRLDFQSMATRTLEFQQGPLHLAPVQKIPGSLRGLPKFLAFLETKIIRSMAECVHIWSPQNGEGMRPSRPLSPCDSHTRLRMLGKSKQ